MGFICISIFNSSVLFFKVSICSSKTLESGVGLIITGYAFVSEDEQPNPKILGISDDRFIEEYKKLTSAVHREGSKIALQIVYEAHKIIIQNRRK
ncbi:oxidoreductase [Acetoanaerobium pronyense]|uniref:oxidoreductase n=1 Tax=Acetoanaerobium pronyense TaxID=1482736 RepID=UPI001AE402F7|nr:hypothetical protein [Acetoanaerobium pronyense]